MKKNEVRYDIISNLPHGAKAHIAKLCDCSVNTVINVLKGRSSDVYNIIEKSEIVAAMNIWKDRFCKHQTETDWKKVLHNLPLKLKIFNAEPTGFDKYVRKSAALYTSMINGENNEKIEQILRNNVSPPIKGDITVKKIVWRGIKMIRQRDDLTGIWKWWIEQRGERVSPIIKEQI